MIAKPNFNFPGSFKLIAFASAAGGLRTCDAAAFSPLKKLSAAADFFNAAIGVTAEKEATYTGTGDNSEVNESE